MVRPRTPAKLFFCEVRGRWVLGEQHAITLPDGRVLTLPAGYQTDLATVPRWFWWFVAPFELSIDAPLAHDVLCEFDGAPPREWLDPYRTYTRAEADKLFGDLMKRNRVRWYKRQPAYWLTRSYGAVFDRFDPARTVATTE
jgi:hypothetical protein